jgi:hypothetical protein
MTYYKMKYGTIASRQYSCDSMEKAIEHFAKKLIVCHLTTDSYEVIVRNITFSEIRSEE